MDFSELVPKRYSVRAYTPDPVEEEKLEQLLDTGKYFAVATVDVHTGKVHFVSTKHVAEKKIKGSTFVKAILASCCEPVFTQPVQMFAEEDSGFKNDLFYDGGVKEFIPLEHTVISVAPEITVCSSGMNSFTPLFL